VESEFAAMSAAIGASVTGARAYTATASQGLLYMAEALFNGAGLGLPIVMTVANRAIGAPINIWNDQSDSMSQRDCGWVQLYGEDNHAAVGLHVLAFRLAERHLLDPDAPVTIGAMVGPEAFTEVRYLAHRQLMEALPVFDDLASELRDTTGPTVSALQSYGPASARTVVLTTGSVVGTVADVVDEGFDDVGVLHLAIYRPFPARRLREALRDAEHVIVRGRAPGGPRGGRTGLVVANHHSGRRRLADPGEDGAGRRRPPAANG
jgi:pyruvate ferredoxin oxidoreductase alpha subunit